MRRILLTSLVGMALCGTLSAQSFPYQDASLPAEQRAEDLLGRLTLEQKASLMMNASPAIPELGIRAYNWWNEALHGAARAGLATVFPQAIGMAASWDEALLEQVFDIASTEQRIKFIQYRKNPVGSPQYHGLTVWTPNINIFRAPRW
ncbi:MAG: glycoside hydrolase family 3 protein, partial [Bacteroidales bacterium]|nr:glycoside hydrolase family 3 protein [Bacteroidales bacterium]